MNVAREQYSERVYENQGLQDLIDLIPPTQTRVLDVGCGAGGNMRRLAARGHEVVGLTLSAAEVQAVRAQGLTCELADITDSALPFPEASFDALVFSHILEHVAWPEEVLRRYVRLLRPGGGVYVALPNVLHIRQRWEFLRGRFVYSDVGLMDRTHLRFYSYNTARDLVEAAGLVITLHRGAGQVPLGPLRRIAPNLATRADAWASSRWPSLFAFHTLMVCLPSPRVSEEPSGFVTR